MQHLFSRSPRLQTLLDTVLNHHTAPVSQLTLILVYIYNRYQ